MQIHFPGIDSSTNGEYTVQVLEQIYQTYTLPVVDNEDCKFSFTTEAQQLVVALRQFVTTVLAPGPRQPANEEEHRDEKEELEPRAFTKKKPCVIHKLDAPDDTPIDENSSIVSYSHIE